MAARIEERPLAPGQLGDVTDIIDQEWQSLDKIAAAVDEASTQKAANHPVSDPDQALEQAQSREGSRANYEAFIDGLKLSKPDRLKLKEMMSEANYINAVETAKEMKASKIPTYEQIVAELLTFTPERLKDICAEMEKPKLQIISDQGFDENIAAMDDNPHYTSADGRPQENTYVNRDSNSPYRNLQKPGKVKVKISDGVPHSKEPKGVSTRLGERRTHLVKKLAKRNIKLIDHDAMATLIQQSLREAKAAGDNSLIVDNWEKFVRENIAGTVTLLDPGSLTNSALVAFSGFNSSSRRACFGAGDPNSGHARARVRASVQVLEI